MLADGPRSSRASKQYALSEPSAAELPGKLPSLPPARRGVIPALSLLAVPTPTLGIGLPLS